MGLALDFRIMSSDSGPSGHSSCMVFRGSEWGLVQVENKGPRLWRKFYFKKKNLKVLHVSTSFLGWG